MIYEVKFISQAFLRRGAVQTGRGTRRWENYPQAPLLRHLPHVLSPALSPNLVPPKRTILSPTIQQHWRRRGHGPFPLGSIFFQVKDPEDEFTEGQRLAAPALTDSASLFPPTPTAPCPSPRGMLFTRIKLPEVVEVPVQPRIVATEDVQLPIVADWEGRDPSEGMGLRGWGWGGGWGSTSG